MAAALLAFACGISIGILIGRRSAARDAIADVPAPKAPTRKARKLGLSEESFQPSDDILEKLRRAADGELDPAVLQSAGPDPGPPTAEQQARSEAEQRVLDRLRRQAETGDTDAS